VVEHFETQRVRKGGQRILVSLTLSSIRDSSRRLIGFSTIARDITEQRRIRDALARRQLELDDLFEHASIGLLLANRAFLNMVDRTPAQVVSRLLRPLHSNSKVFDDLLHRLALRETIQNFPTELLTARGETRVALVDADGLWEKGQLVHSRWFVRDISRRRQLERELLEVSERERRDFAHELHDGLGQQLGGVAYLSNVLREQLSQKRAPETASATRIYELVRKAIEDARRMARGLSPIREEPEGLVEALRELAAQTSELRRVRCRLDCRKPVLVSDTVLAGHLYRIAQEAVNNSLKHASPRAITLSLRHARGRLTLAVMDDGKGIGPLSPNRKGLGLRVMQYRASLIRGALEVTPRRSRGTRVQCSVPLSANAPKPRRK
jgi:signal transduction histidine kinase